MKHEKDGVEMDGPNSAIGGEEYRPDEEWMSAPLGAYKKCPMDNYCVHWNNGCPHFDSCKEEYKVEKEKWGASSPLGKLDPQEIYDAIEHGVHRAIWQMIISGTDMPCADFYDTIKEAATKAFSDLEKP